MTSAIRFHCSALHLAAVVDVAIDALDASRFADAADALEVFCRRRLDGEREPYPNADRRVRDAWAELAQAAGPSVIARGTFTLPYEDATARWRP